MLRTVYQRTMLSDSFILNEFNILDLILINYFKSINKDLVTIV